MASLEQIAALAIQLRAGKELLLTILVRLSRLPGAIPAWRANLATVMAFSKKPQKIVIPVIQRMISMWDSLVQIVGLVIRRKAGKEPHLITRVHLSN